MKKRVLISILLVIVFIVNTIPLSAATYTVTVKNHVDQSFITRWSANGGSTYAHTLWAEAKKAFLNKWDIDLVPSYYIITSGNPPIDACALTNKYTTLCNSSCGDCGTDTQPNHHKNGYKNYYYFQALTSNTGFDLYMYMTAGEICRMVGTTHSGILGGLALTKYSYIVPKPSWQLLYTKFRLMQHELSHNYGCADGGCNDLCVMDGDFNGDDDMDNPNIWCPNHQAQFDPDKY